MEDLIKEKTKRTKVHLLSDKKRSFDIFEKIKTMKKFDKLKKSKNIAPSIFKFKYK